MYIEATSNNLHIFLNLFYLFNAIGFRKLGNESTTKKWEIVKLNENQNQNIWNTSELTGLAGNKSVT